MKTLMTLDMECYHENENLEMQPVLCPVHVVPLSRLVKWHPLLMSVRKPARSLLALS